MPDVQCIAPLAADLGEGPCWVEGALWCVDITARRIQRIDGASGAPRSWQAPDRVSFILPDDGGAFLVGLPGALGRFFPESGHIERILRVEEERPHNRLNDACVDPQGRPWFGSMDDRQQAPNGALYSWDGKGSPVLRDPGYVISNGPAFSPDGRTLYHTDTRKRLIYRFDVSEDGSVRDKRPFIEIEADAGWPDGSSVDAQGCLWVALWGGGSVRRYSPHGELLTVVPIPCANVTKLAFGGEALKTAFVTTARLGLSAEELRTQPLAGGVFTFQVEAPGLPQRRVRLSQQVAVKERKAAPN